jgi:hypothetical protein
MSEVISEPINEPINEPASSRPREEEADAGTIGTSRW